MKLYQVHLHLMQDVELVILVVNLTDEVKDFRH